MAARPPRPAPGVDRTPADRRQALLAGAVAGLAMLAPATPALAGEPPTEPLTITTRDGAVHRFAVELALTPEQQQRGLMFREAMAADRGMLFDFGVTRPVAMWMRNTRLPLDMLFVDAAGTVAGVAADAVPYSETVIPSPRPVRFVLELNAGTARRLGIAAGDRASHPLFAPPG